MNLSGLPQLRYIVYRYGHHSPHSGYSRTAEFGQRIFGADVIPIAKPVPRLILPNRLYWRIAKGTPGYTREAIAAEIKIARRMLRERNTIYHYLYGETTYHYTGFLNNRRGNRIVATFHLPPVGIKKSVQIDWHLKKLSGIVCVGTSQMDYLSDIVGPEKVFFGPLGVDLEYYTPPDEFASRDPNLCLFVGENYRDFPTLRGVIELVAYKRPQTQFVGVTSPRVQELIGTHPNLTLRSGIPESELLDLYRRAALMVLPLKDATANNAVLESMACGLPLVITDAGSTRDYVSPDCAALMPPGNARKMAETILELLSEDRQREQMAISARAQAEKFAWPCTVSALKTVYEKLA